MLTLIESATTLDGSFKHEPLPHAITHIRLLEVLPQVDAQETTIRCRLRCVRLTEYDQCYTALSYTWEKDNEPYVIFVNGQKVGVRSSLFNFLRLYRQKLVLKALPTVFLWIDVLCLDYGNVKERNSQIQIMPSIFTKAKTVLAWLEPPSDPTDVPGGRAGFTEFVEFLAQLETDLLRSRNFHNDRFLATKYFSSITTSTWQFSTAWAVLLYVCHHFYWSRLWVLQENRFAQNLIFMHGGTMWTWSQFRAPFLLIWYLTEWGAYDFSRSTDVKLTQILHSPAADIIKSRLVFETPDKFVAMPEFRYTDVATERWQLTAERKPLSELLKTHQRRLCSDRLDRIYALIGLSDSTLTVDYARSNIELFCAVLLSLKVSLELSFVSMLAHQLDVSAFQYHQNRRSLIKDVPSTMLDQTTTDIIGRNCRTIYSVTSIQARTEISDIIQARLGLQKLNHFRIASKRNIDGMSHWTDFPDSSKDMPRLFGHTPGTSMPIIDGFDLSDTSFRAAMFLNPSSRNKRKAVFGMISIENVQAGDILITEEKMHAGIIVRISGLSQTWLTVIGVVLFARKVTVESESSASTAPPRRTPTSTIRSATLSDFCEHTQPSPFTITGCDNQEHFTLRPDSIQLLSLFGGLGLASGIHSRSSSSTTNKTSRTDTPSCKTDDRRFTSKSERLERALNLLRPLKRSNTK